MKFKSLHLKNVCVLLIASVALMSNLKAQGLTKTSALQLIQNNATAVGLSASDMQNMRISSAYIDAVSGASLIYVQQTYKGVDVFNAVQTFAFKNGKLASVTGSRLTALNNIINEKNGKPSVTPLQAVNNALAHLKLIVSGNAIAKQASEGIEYNFGKLKISSADVTSKLFWLPDEITKKAILTWQVEIQPVGSSDYWLVNVDALKGNIISKINLNIVCDWTHSKSTGKAGIQINSNNSEVSTEALTADALVSSASFKVIPFPAESPVHPGGVPAIKTKPWTLAGTNNNATTLLWNSDGTTTFDSTRGNNVLAQEDHNANNGLGDGANSTTPLPKLTFNFTPHFENPPTAPSNLNFALTNLFYWNNIMHDISYQYGFDEVSGNFQTNNLNRGGLGNDYVFADAQDGSATNNSNFATPKDGTNPRMQMFLFDAVPNFTVNKPTAFAGSKTATESAFSTANKIADKGPVTGNVVLFNDDASGTTHEGCGAAANAAAIAGKIAVVDRGTCGFTVKVKNAQLAGATAVIVADNIPGEYPILMGGTDNTITAPAIMVGFETADTIKKYLGQNTIVNVSLKKGIQLDGDLDNGVISHEFTHGISNRLTGGPNVATCLQNKEQMGEGWSDYMALMVTTNWKTATVNKGDSAKPLGTYVLGQGNDGPGIRYYPYSTNLSINPWTYDSLALSTRFVNGNILNPPDPHIVGEVWCNTLWVMTWELIRSKGINKNLFNANAANGNSIAMNLVLEGMKLQKCSPGFVDGRDGILKADTLLYGAKYSPIIWKAFASRGLGYNASEGSSNNLKDGTADYTLPPSLIAKSATQINEAETKSVAGISISPNPANNKAMVIIGGNKKPLNIELINAAGQQVKHYNMIGESIQLDIPKLSSGMYYIKIIGDGISTTKKLMIQQ